MINNQHFFLSMFDKRQNILIVDDEPFNIMAIQNVFKVIGVKNIECVLKTATNGQEAFNIIKNDVFQNNDLFTTFDLILMDY